jgi:hypothetical protein
LYSVGNIEVKILFLLLFILLLLFEGKVGKKPDGKIFKNNCTKGITKDEKGK